MERNITPENTEFVLLCFEGPDRYSTAGGLGVRVAHLSGTLARLGFTTHLFFVGDPKLTGQESRFGGKLILHRWCQWISEYYPNGVYDGEEEKLGDFTRSIPAFVSETVVKAAVENGRRVVVLAEDWHTADAICRLDQALHAARIRDDVVMFWNLNNTFGFHRIDWPRVTSCATVTTVSRYMRHLLWPMRVNPLVIPNGIPKEMLCPVDKTKTAKIRQAVNGNLLFSKVARWDSSKGWSEAIDAVSELRGHGLKPVLMARGGIEPYGQEVLDRARSVGLKVTEIDGGPGETYGFWKALTASAHADVINIRFPLSPRYLRPLYRASTAVLANSSHEPFGLVGLEAMATGAVTFTGNTGEDYAISTVNSIVLEKQDPFEIVRHVVHLRENPDKDERLRKMARVTAGCFTWEASVRNLIGNLESQARAQNLLAGQNQKRDFTFDWLVDGGRWTRSFESWAG